MSATNDGGSTTTHGAYAPEGRTRSVSKLLAECDQAQAKQLRAWAERIEEIVAAHGADPNGIRGAGPNAHDLMQVSNEMKNHAYVVETFTEELLAKLGGDHG